VDGNTERWSLTLELAEENLRGFAVRTTGADEDFEVLDSVACMGLGTASEHQDKEGREKSASELLEGCALPVRDLRSS